MVTTFNRLAKRIYWIGIILVILPFIYFIVANLLPLEFISCHFRSELQLVIAFLLPLGVILTLFKAFRDKENYLNYILRVIFIRLILAAGLIYCMCFTSFGYLVVLSDCWVDYELLYEKKTDPEVRIVDQISDAGFFHQDGHRIVKVVPVIPGVVYVHEIDTNMLVKSEWIVASKIGNQN